MSAQLFVTPDGRPLGHWRAAFPAARFLSGAELSQDWLRPGVVVWTCGLRLAGLAEMLQASPQLRLVVMSMRPHSEEGLQALEIGAQGYCHALAARAMLREVALVVSHGGLWLGPELMQRAVQAVTRMPRTPALADPWSGLTARESAVARCVSEGAANREIASRLGITQRTVKAHLSAMFEKLGVRDRLQLALLLGPAVQADPTRADPMGGASANPVPKSNSQHA